MGWLRGLDAARLDVVMIFEAATDESAETRDAAVELAARNEAMDVKAMPPSTRRRPEWSRLAYPPRVAR